MKLPDSSSASRRALRGLVGGLTLAASSVAIAGGPLYLCDTGVPYVWPNGGVGIPFNPDKGDLGPLSHDDAVALVTAAFGAWDAVPTATVTHVNAGELPVDVDITNFAPYLFPVAPDGQSAVVFDHTGEIFELLFGPNSGILGFASPEWTDSGTCTVLEGYCFLNGPAFTDPVYALDVMVHEFGHYTGLAHTVVNGQIGLGDNTGPTPNDTFGFPDFGADIVETMYPFYFGPGIGSSTLEADDVAMLSTLYPRGDYLANTASISGTIYSPNGASKLTGINVIARNVANPYEDAVSAISGDFSLLDNDAFAGTYHLNGLTPGAEYAVYVDAILAGGFSTPPISLPGPEEFYNGANESGSNSTDDPTEYTPVTPASGAPVAGIDLYLNAWEPGIALPLQDDGSIEIFLPFTFTICEQSFASVWINANGNITFGSSDSSTGGSAGQLADGPPRVAGLWRDLDPSAGGKVSFTQTADTFSVHWENVPEFDVPDSAVNLTIKLYRVGNRIDVQYGRVTSEDGLAGMSCGSCVATGTETPVDLSASVARRSRLALWRQPAIFEEFNGDRPFDLANKTVLYQATTTYNDLWAGDNDRLSGAKAVSLPFESSTVPQLTEIDPPMTDVDFFRVHLMPGDTLTAETVRGCLDTVIGIFSSGGEALAIDDDSGIDTLSKATFTASEEGDFIVGVSTYPDFSFNGNGSEGGRYVLRLTSRNCPPPQDPGPNNWLVNGSFESGDLTGWTVVEVGAPLEPWGVSDDQGFGFFRQYQPQAGCFLAVNGFDGEGPMQTTLLQDVVIPAEATSLRLEWKDRIQWDLLNYATPTLARTYAVEIVNPDTLAVLQTVYTVVADPGTAVDSGWTSHSVDLSAFVGQTIRLQFRQDIPEAFTGPGQFELDDVRLRTDLQVGARP